MTLGEHGQALYDAILPPAKDDDGYELDADGLEVLTMACRTADDLARLEAELRDAPVLIRGSTGQQRVHPLFAEVRATRALMAQLLARLDLDEADAGAAVTGSGQGQTVPSDLTSFKARKAAGKRWNH